MTLPGPTINAIKSKLHNAIQTKDPHAIAAAVDLPPLPKRIVGSGSSSSQQQHSQHGEALKIDGVDWSNVLNPLLDAHYAIQSVCICHICSILY
jgi:hypothetical protein